MLSSGMLLSKAHMIHFQSSDVYLFFFQDLSLTSSLERCVQVSVKSTQTFTPEWMQWRRCGFQTNLICSALHGLKPSGFGITPGVVSIFIKCFFPSYAAKKENKNPQHFLLGMSTKLWLTDTSSVTYFAKPLYCSTFSKTLMSYSKTPLSSHLTKPILTVTLLY